MCAYNKMAECFEGYVITDWGGESGGWGHLSRTIQDCPAVETCKGENCYGGRAGTVHRGNCKGKRACLMQRKHLTSFNTSLILKNKTTKQQQTRNRRERP